jgi:biotin carboxylase
LYLTPSRLSGEEQRAILDASVQAIAALGLTDGPVHAEMRLNRHGVWMLEVANRPIGGLCARALRFEPDQPYEQILLKAACGLNWRADRLRGGASGVYMLPVRRDGIFTGWDGEQEARAVPGIEDVVLTAKEGQQLKPLPEGASYLGFLFAHAATPDQVEWALRAAERKLIVNTNLSLPVVR